MAAPYLLLQTVLTVLGLSVTKTDRISDLVKNKFDFIIVGAGTAGSLLAARLTEAPNINVLLIEAGANPSFNTEVPAYAPKLLRSPEDWKFKAISSPGSCNAYNNNQCTCPRGKALGGSGSTNSIIYIRGNHRDYDHWAELGNKGWAWKDVRPYFLKSEGNTIPSMANDRTYHSTKGPITVSYAPYKTPSLKLFLQAGQQNNYPIRDVNGEFQSGIMQVALTLKNGSRVSSYKDYLKPVLSRDNLKVIINSYVLKVLFDKKNRAIGVSFSYDGKKYTARASKEVIVSAGAIKSPQILLLSGLGPAVQLKKYKIPIVADLPGVGKNFYEHVGNGALVWTVNSPITMAPNSVDSPKNLLQWLAFKNGPLTVPFAVEGIGFFNTPLANQSIDWPDIQLLFVSSSYVSTSEKDLLNFSFRPDLHQKYFAPLRNQSTFSIIPSVMRPKSVGSIQLQSSDPFADPLIDYAFFSHPDDIKTLVEGTKLALRFAKSKGFKGYNAQFNPNVFPGCEKYKQFSDKYWACTARQLTAPGWHVAGSCKMGPVTDSEAVVDSKLRVYKVKGLRVIDASIMPYIVSGNTNAPTLMIAEKASDEIKKRWDLS